MTRDRRLLYPRLASLILLALIGLLGVLPAAGATAVPETGALLTLMPVPASVTARDGRFRVDEDLTVGGPGPATGASGNRARISAASISSSRSVTRRGTAVSEPKSKAGKPHSRAWRNTLSRIPNRWSPAAVRKCSKASSTSSSNPHPARRPRTDREHARARVAAPRPCHRPDPSPGRRA